MLDIMSKVDTEHKVIYVWFDTGIEYQATKEHLDYLEQKYSITISRVKAIKPIPYSVKKYGQPFLSKRVSEMIYRLQTHGFRWEDDTLENLLKKYPDCRAALRWWTNDWDTSRTGHSQFNISHNRFLKEYIISNPPDFHISSKCCDYAKKKASKQFMKQSNCDLSIIGVRKAEGGVRSTAYSNCFSDESDKNKVSQYRPIFWFTNNDKLKYEKLFDIKHSDCYEKYGLLRTGCVGCPYGKRLEQEMTVISEYEPKLLRAVNCIFKDSYDYTRQYRKYIEEQKKKG